MAQATPAPIRANRARAPTVLEIRLISDSSCSYPEAEREGFEPSRELAPPTRLAGECLQPLGHLSWDLWAAGPPGIDSRRGRIGGLPSPPSTWRGGRVAECGGLESR